MPSFATPGVTLTANTKTILGNTDVSGYLRITLCGFGPVLPAVAGVTMLVDAGIPLYEGPASVFSVVLWGNNAISPAGTFYEIALLDGKKNVIQAGMYVFGNADGTVDLSQAEQLLPPAGYQPKFLGYQPCTGAVPGTIYTAPGPVIAVAYNGVLLPRGLALPTLSYTVVGETITLNFNTESQDRIDAFCIA